ncbi:hypothetical protein MESS4_330139 [Mesorhizobium sp. STM 4661]|nr:hypothetical protein MESS4_330139 [Mesorhizobium sp. STM 4661]
MFCGRPAILAREARNSFSRMLNSGWFPSNIVNARAPNDFKLHANTHVSLFVISAKIPGLHFDLVDVSARIDEIRGRPSQVGGEISWKQPEKVGDKLARR